MKKNFVFIGRRNRKVTVSTSELEEKVHKMAQAALEAEYELVEVEVHPEILNFIAESYADRVRVASPLREGFFHLHTVCGSVKVSSCHKQAREQMVFRARKNSSFVIELETVGTESEEVSWPSAIEDEFSLPPPVPSSWKKEPTFIELLQEVAKKTES